MMKTISCKGLALGVVLVATFLCCVISFGQHRTQKTPQGGSQKETSNAASKNNKNEKDQERIAKGRKEQERIKLAQSTVQAILSETKTILNPVLRIRIRMLVADAYWTFQPEKAHQIVSEEFLKIALITPPENESDFGRIWSAKTGDKPATYKGISIEQVKAQLRSEMLAVISARDPALARSLVAADRKDDKDQAAGKQTDEVLATAATLAESDAGAAANVIKDSLKNGVSERFPFLLTRLREKAPVEASAIFNQVLSEVRNKGDLWNFQRLVPYVLPTELDRLVGGKHYLTDPQRMKDTQTLVEYAAELLYRRIQTDVPDNLAPELVRREYYLWRNVETLFSDLKPESSWLVNTRLRQLKPFLPQSAQGSNEGPSSEERLNKLMAAADAALGDKKDEYLDSAAFNAWRFGQGDLDKAISLAEKIGNTEQRDLTAGTLYFQAGLKYLRSEGPDYALSLARKISVPLMRARLFLAVVATFNSVKALDRARLARGELLNWLRSSDRNSETAWAVLDYLDASGDDDPERNFAAFEILIRVLNSPNLEPENRLRNRIYWHPELHDFRKSLMPMAKADFDRGMDMIQMLNNKELSLQIKAAFCGAYLKMRNQNKKSSPNVISKSEP